MYLLLIMKRYDNFKLASQIEGVPVSIIKAARQYIPGAYEHGRLDWDIVGPYITEHYDELENAVAETLEELKKQRLRKTIVREDWDFDVVKNKYVLRVEVLARLKDIALAQKNVLYAAMIDELPARLVGLSQADITIELEKIFANICAEMSKIKL